MKYVKQFGIILTISFIGEVCNHLIPLPIPASIYGLVILFIGLNTKWIPLDAVRETGKFLIEIMPLMFIPAAVGLIDAWGILKPVCVPVIIITLSTTIIVMGITGRITQFVIRRQHSAKEKEVKENE